MSSAYHLFITRYASAIIFIALVLAGGALSQLEKVRLDASSDSLLLRLTSLIELIFGFVITLM